MVLITLYLKTEFYCANHASCGDQECPKWTRGWASYKSLHVGPILWQQSISSIPRLNFYSSQWLSGKNAAGVLFCLEGPGFDPRPRQISSAPFLRRASPGCDTLTSRKSWQISVTQLLGGAIMELQTLATSVVLLSVRPTPRTIWGDSNLRPPARRGLAQGQWFESPCT